MISVCMIVKDEAQYLKNTLSSIAEYFDDIVVVDTGSTDDTREIAAGFTQKVYDFTWASDFSAARNYSLSFAKYDWVLIIDADEEIASIDISALHQLMHVNPEAIGRVVQVNHIDEGDGVGVVKEPISRLFRKDLYYYQGIIHEQIVPKNNENVSGNRFMVPISLNHIGYRKEILQSKNKIARNISLLKKALESTPEEPYLHYQIGRSYFLDKNYSLAAESFETALALQKNFSYSYNEILIESYGYSLINVGEYKKALSILKYEEYCDSTDFVFLKALILMNNGELQRAVDTFLLCTKMKPGSNEGVNSYKANYNIGVILECSKMYQKAKELYHKCGNYNPALDGIRRIMDKQIE
ncbi:glycosyltransferase [Brenneria izadpanahii]|uniref:Glycosyltransferase n=1 Tax=Brenneria izadpanahii TaxID=2722756 RepID=A0ABX7UQJ1_9GAMM|nr:glycosyltransferase family 2 protein [Brenneria izadpanahii]QTF07993.1 glycosyltransferase [Brenneria izadpanahii]